jgi:uncharacterized membrane protein YidH (DUF202 family)
VNQGPVPGGTRAPHPTVLAPGEDANHRNDHGVARERTELAWSRTALSMLAVLAILCRRLGSDHRVSLLVLVAVAVVGAGLWIAGLTHSRRTRAYLVAHGVLGDPTGMLIMVGTLIVAASAFTFALVASG